MTTLEEVKERLEANGYELIKVRHWKKHDWIVYKGESQGITYAHLILTCRLEDLPLSSVEAFWPLP